MAKKGFSIRTIIMIIMALLVLYLLYIIANRNSMEGFARARATSRHSNKKKRSGKK